MEIKLTNDSLRNPLLNRTEISKTTNCHMKAGVLCQSVYYTAHKSQTVLKEVFPTTTLLIDNL